MPKFNDIDIKKWKEYEDINLESLWIIDNRKKNEYHSNQYHGNFIPQIPEQLIKRYTKKNELVLDLFVGSGTSIYESYDLGRMSIGVDINEQFYQEINKKLIKKDRFRLLREDLTKKDSYKSIRNSINDLGFEKSQLMIFHPPYFNIIKFTDNKNDLSNAETIEEFLVKFQNIVDNSYELLDNNRYVALIIGDIYYKSEWIPLGFKTMNLFINRGYILKSIIVKNTNETKGKRGSRALWRYRALSSDYYLFSHEYIFIFKK